MIRIYVNALLTTLVLSAAVSTTAQAGDHSFSCVTNDKPFGQKYKLFDGDDLQAVDEIDKDGEPQVRSKAIKYKTLRKIIIRKEESTCVSKDGQKYLTSYGDTYLIELEAENPDHATDSKVTLMFLCNDDGGTSADYHCAHEITKTKVLHPTYRSRVIKK